MAKIENPLTVVKSGGEVISGTFTPAEDTRYIYINLDGETVSKIKLAEVVAIDAPEGSAGTMLKIIVRVDPDFQLYPSRGGNAYLQLERYTNSSGEIARKGTTRQNYVTIFIFPGAYSPGSQENGVYFNTETANFKAGVTYEYKLYLE